MKLRELFEARETLNISDLEMEEMLNYFNTAWKSYGVQLELGTHFAQRLNDPRNNPPIELNDVVQLLKRLKQNALRAIMNLPNPYHAVMKDPPSNMNLMFLIKGDKGKERTLILKSIMRKKDFESRSKVFTPNENNLGKPITSPTNIQNFWNWFNGSKVVDDQGRPIVMYHGTASDIEAFSSYVNWFAPSPAFASEYADYRDLQQGGGANVVPCYLKALNPFDADRLPKSVTIPQFVVEMMEQADANGADFNERDVKNLMDEMRYSAREEESGPTYRTFDFWHQANSLFGQRGADALKQLFVVFNFDAIYYTEAGEKTIGVLSSRQVKSVTGNAGTYGDEDSIVREKT